MKFISNYEAKGFMKLENMEHELLFHLKKISEILDGGFFGYKYFELKDDEKQRNHAINFHKNNKESENEPDYIHYEKTVVLPLECDSEYIIATIKLWLRNHNIIIDLMKNNCKANERVALFFVINAYDQVPVHLRLCKMCYKAESEI